MLVSRRRFFKTASFAGTTVALGRLPWADLSAAEASSPIAPPPSWVDRPMRWAQLTLVEDDPSAHLSPLSEHREADVIERSSHAR